MKICIICKKSKVITEFYTRHLRCKECWNLSRKRKCKCNYCEEKHYPGKQGKGRFCSEVCRFMVKVEKTPTCWIWKGAKIAKRYGGFQCGSKNLLAHRVSYELFKGPIPEGMCVCHHCDNGFCVNPDCLFLGTHQDNMDDMLLKKRDRRNGVWKKINPQDLPSLLEKREMGVAYTQLAKQYGCTRSNMRAVLTRYKKKHITCLEAEEPLK